MVDIDYIMELLDWHSSSEDQALGIKLARDVECINAFLAPGIPYGKRVMDNCAIILSERTDEELAPYLVELLEWLQDLNWPGAFCILDRLQQYADDPRYDTAFNICLKYAEALGDEVWESNLRMLRGKD